MRRALAVVLVSLLLACGREAPQPPKPAPPPPSHDDGRVVVRLETDVTTLNYVLHTTEDERQVLSLLYDPLVDLDQNLEPRPGTAARWDVLDGGRTIVLHLDPRATFSDGQPVRASDVLFTLNKIIDEQSLQFSAAFESLDREQTKALDEHTVRVVFHEPHAGRILSFNLGVMPEHVYATGNFKTNAKVIGNGPYVLASRRRGRSIVLERRNDYWREKPRIQSFLFRPIVDDATAWKALQRGDVDVARINNETWARAKDDPRIAGRYRFLDVYRLGYNAIVWNLSDPLLSDARVRRALAMSFDRQSIIDRLYHGQARPVTGPFTPDSWANNSEVAPVTYNPQAASALFASAGWRDTNGDGVLDRGGKPFVLTLLVIAGSDTSIDQAQVFQQSLKAAGVTLEIKPLDESAFYEQVLARNYQSAYVSWTNDPDPDPSSLFHSSQIDGGMNIVGYRSEEADQLMDEARIESDPVRRADLYHELHEVLARDQPYLWIVQVGEKWAVHHRVRDVQAAKGVGLFIWYPGPRAWWVKESR